MESLNFNLQIDMFTTSNDEWEMQNIFYCIFNEGHFRELSSGNSYTWADQWYHIGKVEKNQYNSYDLVFMTNKVYRTEDEAMTDLIQIESQYSI